MNTCLAMSTIEVPFQCHEAPTRECGKVPSQNCRQVPRYNCRSVRMQLVLTKFVLVFDSHCRFNTNNLTALQVPRQQCSQGASQQRCEQVPKQDCQPVQRQECRTVPRQQCEQVPRQQCQQVPRQVCCCHKCLNLATLARYILVLVMSYIWSPCFPGSFSELPNGAAPRVPDDTKAAV